MVAPKLPHQHTVHQLASDWGTVHQLHQQHIPVYFEISSVYHSTLCIAKDDKEDRGRIVF